MTRKALISMLLISVCCIAAGKNRYPRITFGAEWSYICIFHSSFHYNYFTPEGYRMNEEDNFIGLHSNGEVLLHVGYNLNEHWNISLLSGLSGLSNIHNTVPVSIRATRYWGSDPDKDRFFAFADAGSGISVKKEMQEILAGKLGAGYRISLSRSTKLDFNVCARCSYTHPQIYFDHEQISLRWTNRNDAILLSVSAGIGLTF